jgi:nitrogenase-stabilizing/protective protein
MSIELSDQEYDELSSAEDFLRFFGIVFDQKVVHVNRLHILQRFHDYLAQAGERPGAIGPRREIQKRLLERAYQDFVVSNALTEKVFAVFHEVHSGNFVPLEEVGCNLRGAGRGTRGEE